MDYIIAFLAVWLTTGIVAAAANSWLVKERTKIVEEFHKLRLVAFQNNVGVQIEFNSDVSEIGFDSDKARNAVSNPEFKKYWSDEDFAKLVVVALCLTGFLTCHKLWLCWKKLNELKKSYIQAKYTVGQLMLNAET